MHRNYQSHTPIRVYWFSDRIEVSSPGGAYGEVTAQNFGQEGWTSYRNPTLAEILKNLGYAERFGFGLPQAKKALTENGNPDMSWKVTGSFVVITIKPHSEKTVAFQKNDTK